MKHLFQMYKMAQYQVAAYIKIYEIFRSVIRVLWSLCVIVAYRKEDCKDNTTLRHLRL